jgi:hypothetical protein
MLLCSNHNLIRSFISYLICIFNECFCILLRIVRSIHIYFLFISFLYSPLCLLFFSDFCHSFVLPLCSLFLLLFNFILRPVSLIVFNIWESFNFNFLIFLLVFLLIMVFQLIMNFYITIISAIIIIIIMIII